MNTIQKPRYIFILFLIVSMLCFSPKNLKAEFDANISIGYSGIGLAMILIDYVGGSNGEFVNLASEYGLITGEIVFGFDLHGRYVGIRTEGLFGYFKYSVFEIPNTSYAILLAGVEPYFKIAGLLFGVGGGAFWGLNWQEVFGSQMSPYHSHRGYTAWITFAIHEDTSPVELNARLRWHHFLDYSVDFDEDAEKLTDDFVFILRFCFIFNII